MGKRIIISENQYDRIFLTHNHNFLFEGDKVIDFDKDGDVDVYDVQQFLINVGVLSKLNKKGKSNVDGDFKDVSSEAFAKYHYGKDSQINTLKKLYNKLKDEGLPVGEKYGFGKDMLNVIINLINNKKEGNILDKLYKGFKDYLVNPIITTLSDMGEAYIEELLKKHIKNKEDGNSFRKWVLESQEREDKVNSKFKDLGYSDILDPEGDIDNKYFKVAWRLYGDKYINKSGYKSGNLSSEEWIKNISNSIIDKDENKEYNVAFKKWVKNEFVNNQWIKNYNGSLMVWDKYSRDRGWDTEKSVVIDADGISRIISGGIPSTTCMDPSYLLLKIQEYTYKLGTIINEGIEEVTEEPIGDYPVTSNHKQRLEKVLHTKAINTIYDTDVLDDESFLKSSSTLQSGEKYDSSPGEAYKSMSSFFKEYNLDTPETLDILSILNTYNYTLKVIDIQNRLIKRQPSKEAFNNCNKKTWGSHTTSTECCPTQFSSDENPWVRIKWDYVYEMKDVCKNHGGVFFTWDVENRNEVNKFCSCTKGTISENEKATVTLKNPYGFQSKSPHNTMSKYRRCSNTGCVKTLLRSRNLLEKKVEIDINNQFEMIDTQSWSSWWKNKTVDCVTDWHCIADIASIVAYAFGPYGWAISVAIDAISALGYVVEGDEGWKMNAGFTILGALGGAGELGTFAKHGMKVSNVMLDIGKAVKGLDVIESRRIIKKILKTAKLSESELKAYKSVAEMLEKMNKGDAQKVLNKLKKQINELNTVEKGAFKKYINSKDFTPEKFLKDLGSDKNLKQLIKKILKKSGIKSAVFGGSVFLGMYMFSKQLGDGLKSIYDSTGFDLLGVFNEEGELDIDKVDPDLMKLFSDEEKVTILKDQLNVTISDDQSEKLNKLEKISNEWWRLDTYYKDEETKNESVSKKLAELFILIDDKTGFENKNIDEIVNIVVPQLKSIKEGDKNIINKIDDIINDVSGTKKIELSKKESTLMLLGNGEFEDGDGNFDFDAIEEAMEYITAEDLKETNEYKDNIEDMKRLNEEIKRIKSLFSDERLYGNLVNEVGVDLNNDKEIDSDELGLAGGTIDYDEAYEFLGGADGVSKMLQNKDHYVVKSGDDDICLGKNTSLGKIWRKYNSNAGLKFSPWKDGSGCVLSIWKTSNPNPVNILNLYEFVGAKRFSLFVKTNISGKEFGCEKPEIPLPFTNGVSFNITGEYGHVSDGATPPKIKVGAGLTYIKLEGTWEPDNVSGFTLTDMVIKRYWNKNRKGVKNSLDLPTPPFPSGTKIDLTLWGMDKTEDFEPDEAGPDLFVDGAGGTACVGISVPLSVFLGAPFSSSQKYKLDDIINQMKL